MVYPQKNDLTIRGIAKSEAEPMLLEHHYLSEISKGFKSGFNYGCYAEDTLIGVIIFTGFPVPELSKGMLGLDRADQKGLFELSRLCLEPNAQREIYNLASWFIAKTIKLLRKNTPVRVILSYADADYHNGTVYAASNFKYYGLTARKKDFYVEKNDGTFVKLSRGKTKGIAGEWRDRTRKNRFVMCFDRKLKVLWKEETWNK